MIQGAQDRIDQLGERHLRWPVPRGGQIDGVQQLVGGQVTMRSPAKELGDVDVTGRPGIGPEVRLDDFRELFSARWLDREPDTAAQERRRELALAVAGDDD